MGDTGAGKSSTLNGLLGEESVLPTNGMRACTAVIIEIRFNIQFNPNLEEDKKTNAKYIGHIEFLEKEEWEKELNLLFSDLKGEDGKINKKVNFF